MTLPLTVEQFPMSTASSAGLLVIPTAPLHHTLTVSFVYLANAEEPMGKRTAVAKSAIFIVFHCEGHATCRGRERGRKITAERQGEETDYCEGAST